MATDKGVWNLQQVRDKQLQSLWTYSGSATEGAQLWTWGQGPVGNNTAPSYSSPVQIPGDWKKYYNSFIKFGIKEGDTLWAWGDNNMGTLGQNNRTTYSSPIQIPGTWSAVMTGNDKDWYKAGAITTDGELFCWGHQNGANIVKFLDDVNYSSPVQLPGTTWKQGSWDRLAAYWTKTDGTMYAIGSNMYGQLGAHNGGTGGGSWTPTSRSSPVQIPGTSWSHVSGSLALRTDGSLWTWGANERGQLGQNAPYNGGHRSSPVQITGTWKSISHGDMCRIAINTDGEMFAWGYNIYGHLGLNNRTQYSSPVQVGSDTTWESVAMFNYITKAIKTDGTLWAWGWNGQGEAAQNNRTNYSSPVQIPGSWLSNRLETTYGGTLRF